MLTYRYEDGTINFLSIVALRHGLDWQVRAGLSMPLVSRHCFLLASYTHMQLRRLRHSNDQAAVYMYADTGYDDPDTQGGIVNFNMLRDSGEFVGYMEVSFTGSFYLVRFIKPFIKSSEITGKDRYSNNGDRKNLLCIYHILRNISKCMCSRS